MQLKKCTLTTTFFCSAKIIKDLKNSRLSFLIQKLALLEY